MEYNASLPADVEWKVHYDAKRMWDGSHNFGASLKAFETLGRRLGYSLVGCELSDRTRSSSATIWWATSSPLRSLPKTITSRPATHF